MQSLPEGAAAASSQCKPSSLQVGVSPVCCWTDLLCAHPQAEVFAPEQILQMVPQCDYLVCCTPYNPDTHLLVSAAAIAAMKPTAVFINVGRGKCVDEAALVQGAWCAGVLEAVEAMQAMQALHACL